MIPRLLTFAEVAEALRFTSVAELRRALIATNLLPIVILSPRKRYVSETDLQAFIANRTTTTTSTP